MTKSPSDPKTYRNLLGETVEVLRRGKHYVQPKGYAASPGTGPKGETCGGCRHKTKIHLARVYHKCQLASGRWTGGRGSDILVRSPACLRWEPKMEKDPPA